MCRIKKKCFTAHYVSVVLKRDARDQNSDLFSTWYLLIHTSVVMYVVHQRLTIIQEGYQDKCWVHDIISYCNFLDKIQLGGLKISERDVFLILQVI